METLSTTEENPVTAYENHVSTDESILTTDRNPVTAYENLVRTSENPVASDESILTTDRNPVTAYENLDTTDKNESMTYENNVTINGISEEIRKFDSISENFSNSPTLAVTLCVSGGIIVILTVSAIIAFFYWRSKKGKTNQDRNLEPARANHPHGTSDYSVLDADNIATGNRPPEHIYNHVPSISGRVDNEAENDINTGPYPHYSEIEEIRRVENEPENNIDTGQYSQYSEISDIRTVENENNIKLGQHSLYSEPVESSAVENEPGNHIDTGLLSLYSEPVESRSEENTAQSNEYATIA
ncbi:hypothetical protein PoB_004673400 [Plakobranchus ocellatus]|uniref:Uncharacterized protein n=1 Tax=Plakobranchus ocellatus TaxID=259542 RepID=A0AAV4BMW0_9GAST|nr:hypothetical protein PoB_004673400 [Plakobranchus ocellatus]